MGEYKEKLLKKAKKAHKKIIPCGGRKSFSECFTDYGNELIVWFIPLFINMFRYYVWRYKCL